MCYERRSLASVQQKKAATVAETFRERDNKRKEVVGNLLREADKAGQNANAAPAKEYTPAK